MITAIHAEQAGKDLVKHAVAQVLNQFSAQPDSEYQQEQTLDALLYGIREGLAEVGLRD